MAALVLLLIFLSLFQNVISHISQLIATKLCHMLGSDCELRKWVGNLGALPVKFGPINMKIWYLFLDNFLTL